MDMDLTATEQPRKKRNSSATTAPASAAIIVPSPDEVLWTSTHPQGQADGFRYMQNRLGLSNAWLDEAGGFGDEQVSKYLGPSRAKQIGPWYYMMLNSLLAVKWEMKDDMAQVAKMEKLWEARKPQYVQPLSRPPSKQLMDRVRPYVLKEMGKRGAEARRIKREAAKRTTAPMSDLPETPPPANTNVDTAPIAVRAAVSAALGVAGSLVTCTSSPASAQKPRLTLIPGGR